MQSLAGIKQNNQETSIREKMRGPVSLHKLTAKEEPEVLDYLQARPAHTFGLVGFIRTNGLVSPHNRGDFYGCRNATGELIGVALIGRHVLIETQCATALRAFAHLAQTRTDLFMMLGEPEVVEAFWQEYSAGGQAIRRYCRELLMEQRWPVAVCQAVSQLRQATLADLDQIVPAHAQAAFEESGVNPLEVDADGFRQRCARRIEKGKTWVLIEDGKLLFKADVVTDSPKIIYLEGIWVDPDERGKGYASRCLSQLNANFLQRTQAVCILVNERLTAAQTFYGKVGFKLVAYYDTIFFVQDEAHDS